MNLSPVDNVPAENSYYEEGLQSYDRGIAELEAALEATTDEARRGELTENLEAMRQGREEYARTARWEVEQESIDSYQAIAQHFAISREGIWDEKTVTQVQRYIDGKISAQQLVERLLKTSSSDSPVGGRIVQQLMDGCRRRCRRAGPRACKALRLPARAAFPGEGWAMN